MTTREFLLRLRVATILPLALFVHSAGTAAERPPAGTPVAAIPAGSFRFTLAFATFLGGSDYDDLREITVLADGSLLLGGQTVSADFPVTTGALQTRYGGEPAGAGHPGVYGGDCLLARLSADGRRILAATYFGGSKQERDVYGMAVDQEGNVVITTTTRSADLPTTAGAFQSRFAGGEADVVVANISADFKRLIWCTYLGGSGGESPRGGLDLDAAGNVFIVGNTKSPNFPTTAGVVGPKPHGDEDAFVVKLKADGTGVVWSTLLGGRAWDGIIGVRVDAVGTAFLGGHTQSDDFPVTPGAPQARLGGKSDCFLAALSPDARRLLYATYVGGAENEFAEHRVALLANGSVILPGVTASKDFPTTARAFQRALKGKSNALLTRLSPDGTRLEFSTFLGGTGEEYILMPSLDAAGNIYVVGHTASADFPVTPDALQSRYGGGGDGVFAILSPDGSQLRYATYLGGSGEDLLRSLVLLPGGGVCLIGKTASDNFPTTAGVAQSKRKGGLDGFVVKLARSPR